MNTLLVWASLVNVAPIGTVDLTIPSLPWSLKREM